MRDKATKSIRWAAPILALAALVVAAALAMSGAPVVEAQSAPRNVSATVDSATEVTVEWEYPQNIGTGITAYVVQYKLGSASDDYYSWNPRWPNEIRKEPGDRSHQFTGLSPTTSYDFRVRACNSNCTPDSPWAIASATTPRGEDARPSTPANLRAVPLGPDSVQLTWDASDGGKVNGETQTPRYVYQIDGDWGPNWGAIPGGNVASHIVTGLDTFNNSYTFRIRAESEAGNSWFTGDVTSDRFRPRTPTNLTATSIGPESVLLEWEAQNAGVRSDGEPIVPRYQYDVDGIWGDVPEAGATSHVVTTDAHGRLDTFNNTYQFRVSALSGNARSWWTGYVTSGNFRPATPTNLTATTIGPESVLLEWEAQDAGVGSDGEPITPRYQYDVDGLWGDVPEAGATSHVVDRLDTVNNTYEFRLSALSEDARSWWTGYVTSELLPAVSIASVEITSDPGDDATYRAGDTIRVSVRFTDEIRFDIPKGTEWDAELKLDFDGTVKTAKIEGGLVDTLGFSYEVQVGDEAADGIAIGANSLILNSLSSIRGVNGGAVDISHDAIPADPNHRVGAPGGL